MMYTKLDPLTIGSLLEFIILSVVMHRLEVIFFSSIFFI